MSSRIIQALAPRARTARVFVAIAVAGLSAAACDVHGISEPGSLSAIVVSPNPATIAANGTQQFSAVGKDFSGTNVTISPSWSVVAGGGTISASGLFTAGPTPGTYASTVKATNGSISGTATVIVTIGPLASITVTPNPDTLAIKGTQLFTAVGRDVAGNVVVITPTWSVVASGGTITTAGSFTAGTVPGTFLNTVKATSGTLSGTADVVVKAGPLATITVTPNPATVAINGTQQFTAVGKDSSGNVVAITPVWSAVSGGTIITGTGLFTAGTVPATFTNTVKAAVGTVNGTATVVVTAGQLDRITVTPNPDTLAINGTTLFVATGLDIAGNTVGITPKWAVVASGGTIDTTTGLFTAGPVPGTFIKTVTATSGTKTGTATVVVTAGPLATITVTPNPDTIVVSGKQQFTAVGRDSSGNLVVITPTWAVVASGGTITGTGLFTADTVPGTFTNTVKATSGTHSGTATVVVVTGQLASITVTPNPDTLKIKGTQQFTAVGRDAAGNPVAFTITPTWTVVANGGTITGTGLFTADTVPGTFLNTVKATSGTLSGTATVVVTAGTLATITVTPNPDTVSINGQTQFIATGRDSSGNLVVITPKWAVVASGGTIDSTTGLFTAGLTTGTFPNTVKATVGTVNGTATVVVIFAQPPFLDLGTAALNGIMAGQTVTCITGGTINADVSVSPGSTVTGYPPCVITGTQHLADAVAALAQQDLTTAYNTLQALPCGTAISADLGGTTVPAGVYCTASGIGLTGPLTLNGGGDPNAVFVFQAGTSLTTAGDILLINGAQAKNVYFQVGSSATLGTASQIKGNILALTSITLVDNANLIGRALARNGSVTLGTNNTITLP